MARSSRSIRILSSHSTEPGDAAGHLSVPSASDVQMKNFHCDHCGALVFFENVQCVSCGHTLAFLQDLQTVSSLESTESGQWQSPLRQDAEYRLCANYSEQNI